MQKLTEETDHLNFQVLETLVPNLGWILHLKVWRVDNKDGITWDELQAIKDEALGSDTRAIEIYPPAYEVVDETNTRHLWAIPGHISLPNLWRQ
jgi:hypothetical protein